MSDIVYAKESYDIKKACINVKNELSFGFLERIYEKALKLELENMNYKVKEQYPIDIYYKNKKLCDGFYADLVVNDKIIIELKAVKEILDIHKAQLLNYLKASKMKLGLLINFRNNAKSFDFIRIVNTR